MPIQQKKDVRANAGGPADTGAQVQLMFDGAGDRISGNAAILYLDSVLLLNAETRDKIHNAVEAYDTDKKAFGSIADSIEATSALKEVELAGRRIDCDWESPFREMGAETLLPHLEPLLKGVGRLLWVRATGKLNRARRTRRSRRFASAMRCLTKLAEKGRWYRLWWLWL